ncbi:MAG: murein hydrolase activator EnvC family protein [Candidatus Aminicenantes bacterium]
MIILGLRTCPSVLKNRTCFLLAAVLLAMAFFPAESFSQQDVSEYQKRLAKLARQIEELRSRIKKGEKRESTILSRLDGIGFQKNLIKKEISAYNIRLNKANQELSSLKKSIPPLEAKLDREKQSMATTLITLYKFGKFSHLRFILHAEDMGSYISESKNLSLLAQYQQEIISDYLHTLSQLQAARSALEEKKGEISRLLQNAHQKRKELQTQEHRHKALITKIERDRKTHLKTLDELKERAQQLQNLIKKLLKQEISLPFALIPLYEKKGNLPWPVGGKVAASFGLRRHPRFNTVTKNNGIEIVPGQNNMMVKAVHPGKVVYADYFQGYGNLIIIDHGLNYYSLYGHCSDFLVDKGDFIKSEQPIAFIGDFSSLRGLCLYFEIRYKTKPLDPLQWLKRR